MGCHVVAVRLCVEVLAGVALQGALGDDLITDASDPGDCGIERQRYGRE